MLGKTSESEVSSHLYDLIYELNQVAPNVLFAVLPQLEFKLKVDMGCNDSYDFYKCQVLSQRDRAIVCVRHVLVLQFLHTIFFPDVSQNISVSSI